MSTRICVKNLGKNCNEKQLRETFEKRGEITDVRIIKTATGKSRLFGFVGFRSPAQALEAVSYFNNTYIDSSRISVEIAKKVGDNDLESSRSIHAKKKVDRVAAAYTPTRIQICFTQQLLSNI